MKNIKTGQAFCTQTKVNVHYDKKRISKLTGKILKVLDNVSINDALIALEYCQRGIIEFYKSVKGDENNDKK